MKGETLLRVGVLGLGRMGKLHFLNALRMKDVKVVAVADRSKKKRRDAERYHVETYDDYEKLIESEELDAVVISLPNHLKAKGVFSASEKGLDIFLDKPLARNLAEAEKIVGTVRTEDIRLMVGANCRYFDSVQKLKTALDEGRVGDIVIATSELIGDGPFSHPLVPKPVPEWWFDKEKAGGGALLDIGYHLIDILNWMFGDLEIQFSTLGYRYGLPVEDSAIVVFRCPTNGVRCVVNAGWFSRLIFPNFNFRINLHGTAGYVSTDHFAPRDLRFHAIKEATLNLFRRVTGREARYLSYTYYYASFFEVLDELFQSIRNDVPLPVSLEDQLSVIKIIESIYNHNGVS